MSLLQLLNDGPPDKVLADLQRCCGSARWAAAMLATRPFPGVNALLDRAQSVWFSLNEADWLEAFSHHPRIGEGGMEVLRKKFATTATWASTEQAGMNSANDATLHALAAGNEAYAKKFGFIFIVCATGKSAAEMLALLEARLPNDRSIELKNAAVEQSKITALRWKNLPPANPISLEHAMPAITTHVLDTARGAPARNVPLVLEYLSSLPNNWQTLNAAVTNDDGRVPALLPTGHILAAGTYRLTFDTAAYFASLSPPTDSFYPKVEILFTIRDPLQHYHVPLLLSPFGYSTYRGS